MLSTVQAQLGLPTEKFDQPEGTSASLLHGVTVLLADDIRFVNLEPSEIDSEQLWRVSFLYCLLQWASRHDCLVRPSCSHIDELWLRLIEGDDSEHDIWLWAEGDEAWIRENALLGHSDYSRLKEDQWNSARQALRRRLGRTPRAPHLASTSIAARNGRIHAATPAQRLAAMTWLIYTSKYEEELDHRCGWSSRSRFSLGELIRTWREDLLSLFGILPSFPEQPDAWKRFIERREGIGCICMDSQLFREPVHDWLRMVAWLQDTILDAEVLDPCRCQPCNDKASAEYDVFYGADHFWDTPCVPLPLVFSLEALSFLNDCSQPAMLSFAVAMVSKSLLPGSRSIMDTRLRHFYDEGDKDFELSPWINSHPSVGRKHLERYACYLGSRTERPEIAGDFPDDCLEALPGAFAQGAPNLVVFIGTLAWVLGSRFLGQSYTVRNWHDYWGQVLRGGFMAGLYLQVPTETTRILADELKRTHSAIQDSSCGNEWDDDLWNNYAAIMEFVKSIIPDSQFEGCPKCHAVYLHAMDTPVSLSDQRDTRAGLLQKHFGHIPNLTQFVKRIDVFPAARGGYADIYKCRLRQEDGRYINVVAVKVFRSECCIRPQLDAPRSLRREIKVWHTLRHRNIVPLLGVVSGFGAIVSAVSPWVSGGPLRTYLDQKSEYLSLSDRYNLVEDVAQGLKCLHSFPIIHGDLSDGNVLVEDDGTARLSDFGLCTVIGGISGGSSMTRRTIHTGTIPFAAPELILNNTSSSKMSDIYSLGCIMLQVLSGQSPWEKTPSPGIVVALNNGERVPRPEHRPICDKDWAFIERCCSTASGVRPTIIEVLDCISVMKDSLNRVGLQAPLTVIPVNSSGPLSRPKRHYREVDSCGLTNENDKDIRGGQDTPPPKRQRSFLECAQL